MSDEESPKPVNVDPRCIQEALRMFLQPIKHDDPQLDFYTMYKRETMEYDTEYMQKYNEDLNTTLIFAGLFSAVSSAFVVDVQSQLQPDPTERSEAYLRAILISLNRSIAPSEDPVAPPPWNGPPTEIITTSGLLYASLLMSLLAAFVAMLGKQWLNRYLRHTGGSTVERCGDRQLKYDGLEKWPFRVFIESLPIILQIALFLLACGLSRYMWSVNTSVARVIISFTVLTMLFFIGIVVAGTWSYECPFQTPASTGLRYLRDSGTARKLLASLSPSSAISLVYATWRNTSKFLAILSPPSATSLIYAIWMDACQELVPASRRLYNTMRHPSTWGISLRHIASGIRSMPTKAGHQTIIIILRIDRALGNAKHRLAQRFRRFRRAGLLPITFEDAHRRPLTSRNRSGLRLRVRNLESIRRRNMASARCVCWVLRNITDPEAIDSAIRLAGTIRWFDGDSDFDPPFDLIVSSFEACFDSTKRLYPGMRDRAYFSARAILQINACTRVRSHEHASKYPIPAVPRISSQHTDPDLHHILGMLELNFGPGRRTIDFPRADVNTRGHLSWMSTLFVDVTRAGPNPIMKSYKSYLGAAITDDQPGIANTLLMWYMFLGGHIEEDTFWADDKSDSLETILSHLSTRVIDIILDRDCIQHLHYLLSFLAGWEKRPACLTRMAYEWCSAISEAAGGVELGKIPIIWPFGGYSFDPLFDFLPRPKALHSKSRPAPGLRSLVLQVPASPTAGLAAAWSIEGEFAEVGPCYDPVRLDNASHRTRRGPLEDPGPLGLAHFLSLTLEIGFRLVVPDRHGLGLHLNHTSHHGWVLETAFSSHDDEVIADGVCAWIEGRYHLPSGSLVRYFAKRVGRDAPFSPRLRRVAIFAVDCIELYELEISPLATIQLLNRLDADPGDPVGVFRWEKLLAGLICSSAGPGSLSSHYWGLLDRLVQETGTGFFNLRGMDSLSYENFVSRGAEVARSLEEAEDWEKLETWMTFAWKVPGLKEDVVGPMTLKLLSHRPSALPKFEDLCRTILFSDNEEKLRRICDQARTEQPPSETPPPQLVRVRPLPSLPFAGDDTF